MLATLLPRSPGASGEATPNTGVSMLNWAITLGHVAGIAVRLHVTFLILLAWIAIAHFLRGGAIQAVQGVAFILAIFGSVLLHEFGHALAARRYGVRTPDITLLPIGGVARLERIPEKPQHELVVALAGPAVNVGIAAILFLLGTLLGAGIGAPMPALFGAGGFLSQVLWVNLWLVLFNLIPAFPMDGGRVLRALLAIRTGFARATRVAASVGQAFAFIFALLGFFGNPLLLFIALFVYLGASGEASSAQMKDVTAGVPVRRAMETRFDTLETEAQLSRAVTALLEGSQREFPVIDERGQVVGMLTRDDMVRGLNERGKEASIRTVMQSRFPAAYEGEGLQSAFERMMGAGHSAIPVINHQGDLVGLLTRDNVAEMMMLKAAWQETTPTRE